MSSSVSHEWDAAAADGVADALLAELPDETLQREAAGRARRCCKRRACVRPSRLQVRNWIALFVIGTINNLPYVVVGSAAQDVANQFNERNLIGLIPWANVAFGFIARSINAWGLHKLAHKWRVLINAIVMVLGLFGLAFSFSFAFSVSAIVLVGASSSFGESVIVGYLKFFPSKLVGGWSSGTGMAGVSGSLLYIALSATLIMRDRMLVVVPAAGVYFLVYALLLKRPPPGTVDEEKEAARAAHEASVRINSSEADTQPADGKAEAAATTSTTTLVLTHESVGTSEERTALLSARRDPDAGPAVTMEVDDVRAAKPRGRRTPRCCLPGSCCARSLAALRLVWWNALNMCLVYLFEYVISTGCADKAEIPDWAHSPRWEVRHAFVILSFCYQFGVLLSRSSLQCFRIRRVWILTVLQGANMILWICQAKFKFMDPWLQFPIMVYVGLLGGASYVNVFYLILHDPRIEEKERELAVNVAALFITLGIVTASVFILIMDDTFLASS